MQSYEQVKSKAVKLISVHRKIIKYLVSGVTSLAADYGTFLLLYYILNISLRISVPTGLVTGLVVSFVLNKFWAFEAAKQLGQHKLALQMVMYGILVALNTAFTYYFVKVSLTYSVPASVSKLVAVAATVCWNYVLYKKVIFRESKA